MGAYCRSVAHARAPGGLPELAGGRRMLEHARAHAGAAWMELAGAGVLPEQTTGARRLPERAPELAGAALMPELAGAGLMPEQTAGARRMPESAGAARMPELTVALGYPRKHAKNNNLIMRYVDEQRFKSTYK